MQVFLIPFAQTLANPYIVEATQDNSGQNVTTLLIAKRKAIQAAPPASGKPQCSVPEWACQWGLFGGNSNSVGILVDAVKMPDTQALAQIRQAAFALFETQTGISEHALTDTYNGAIQTLNVLSMSGGGFLAVLPVFLPLANDLGWLQREINGRLDAGTVPRYELDRVWIATKSTALPLFSTVTPPENQWTDTIIRDCFGGKTPGQLNTDIDLLQKRLITAATDQSGPELFTRALTALP